jgi:hypothetical protein
LIFSGIIKLQDNYEVKMPMTGRLVESEVGPNQDRWNQQAVTAARRGRMQELSNITMGKKEGDATKAVVDLLNEINSLSDQELQALLDSFGSDN